MKANESCISTTIRISCKLSPQSGEERALHGKNVKFLYDLSTKGMCLETVAIIVLILIHTISFIQQIVKILYKINLSIKHCKVN